MTCPGLSWLPDMIRYIRINLILTYLWPQSLYHQLLPAVSGAIDVTHKNVWTQFSLMANVTVSVDEDLKQRMDEHPEINWSEVARQAFQEKLEDLELMEKLASESSLTEEDVEEISRKINQDVADRLVRE